MANLYLFPSGPGTVQMLRIINASFSSISLTWDELSCEDHNGPLTGYRVEYGNVSFETSEVVSGVAFTATGLLPLTTYMFRVAAVSENGSGVFSAPVNQTTLSSGNKPRRNIFLQVIYTPS